MNLGILNFYVRYEKNSMNSRFKFGFTISLVGKVFR
jgi:hypothetical protein